MRAAFGRLYVADLFTARFGGRNRIFSKPVKHFLSQRQSVRMKLSRAELKWINLDLGDDGRVRGFFDIVVDGESLYNLFWSGGIGTITPMGAFPAETEIDKYVSRLIGELQADSWAGQCCIYVCRECGDIDCGAVTVKVEKRDDMILWTNFAYEYPDFYDEKQGYNPIEPVKEYCFEASQLRDVLLGRPR